MRREMDVKCRRAGHGAKRIRHPPYRGATVGGELVTMLSWPSWYTSTVFNSK